MEILIRLLMFVAAASVPSILAALTAANQKIRRLLGCFVIIITGSYNVYFLRPSAFQINQSLPLQVCDLLGFIAILDLMFEWRFARTVIILCVVPFVLQAVLTPVGEQRIDSLRTILYWSFHFCIFATFIFDAFIEKVRVELRDFANICLLDLGYVSLITPINIVFGLNYGYIGNAKPGVATLVDVLGPWPFRIVSMTVLAMVLQFVCFLMFVRRRAENGFR